MSKDLLRRFAANASLVVNQLMTTAADEGEDEEEARGGKITYARAADAAASGGGTIGKGATEVFLHLITGSSKKNLAKFSDTCSVRADGLCIGSPRLVGGRKA